MNSPLKHSPLLLSLAIALSPAIPFSAIAQNATTPASPTTTTQTKSVAAPNASKAVVAPSSRNTVEYKDPEDMTTRYRPGNNKTTNLPAAGSPATPQATAPAPATDAKKHVANVKYNDRQAAVPDLDAASKDAAKAKVAPTPSPATTKQGSTSTQDSKHVNKVDSFTVKQ